jgi:hypothetical protein
MLVRIPGIPKIERHICAGTQSAAQEPSLAVMRVAAKKLGPIPIRAIDFFKAAFKARLDIELPED